MSLPGGSAEKLGNRYEGWWTVKQFVRILHGQAESIHIEDPGVEKAEFTVVCSGRTELHQAKRSHSNGKWTLASLAEPRVGVLQAIFSALSGSDSRFVFVSGSSAGDLAELAERASEAPSIEEFQSVFLEAKVWGNNFEKLKGYWKGADTAEAYEVLRRIEVRTVDERGLQDEVQWSIQALFLANPQTVCSELRSIAQDSIHQTLTRDLILERLAQRGFWPRRLVKPESASTLIGEVTNRYLADARKKLIRKTLLPCAATKKLLGRLDEEVWVGVSALTGKAGSGKTACVIEYVEALRARRIPVLVFRLDRLKPVSTAPDLGELLGLEESPALVLAAAAAGRKAVLVIDQLDAVSTASGRNSDLLYAVEEILAEARGLGVRSELHVVLVCRSFDWENDHRLRRMLSEKDRKVDAHEFSAEEVKAVLLAEGYRAELFQSRQLDLLRHPQNLSLFLDAGFEAAKASPFRTAKDLFDHYWDNKRRAVTQRSAPLADQWMDVIELLCGEMTRTQQLSVPREKLDRFAPGYVLQMASEGVLTFDGQRYGFGHESFFDYCFARGFVTQRQAVLEFLSCSEQHLFRRAQVRQVLTYLRDADPSRYCSEVGALLREGRIRAHIKDLVAALLFSVPDPGENEWVVAEPWLTAEMGHIEDGRQDRDQLASLIWRHFFFSSSWFPIVDRHGLIQRWLDSENVNVLNTAVSYLNIHQRQFGDRVAELVEPKMGKGEEWQVRLRLLMQWAEHANSRRFFEFFLKLIDDGTLDEARGPIAVNSTFWSMLHGLEKTRPAWFAEVLAHWLRRRATLIQGNPSEDGRPDWRGLFGHDSSGAQLFRDAAAAAPSEFVQHVLPVVLQLTDDAVHPEEADAPRRDAIWPLMYKTQYETSETACLHALVASLQTIAIQQPEVLASVIADLRHQDGYTSNFLLLHVYVAGAARFADEAAVLISEQPWRFRCGFSDSTYWAASEMIRAIVQHCRPESLALLEKAALDYCPRYEHTARGHEQIGRASFALLSAIPGEFRSPSAQARFRELERKFNTPAEPPRGIRVFHVGSPIKKEATERMTDEQWLSAIAKYAGEHDGPRFDDPEKGGASELARLLQEYAKKEGGRFARLSLRFPPGTNPVYLARTLDGLRQGVVPIELKLAVCQKAFAEGREHCGMSIADVLGSVDVRLPDDAVAMVAWLATESPDPEKEMWREDAGNGKPYYGGSILDYGINTTRGRAAEAVRDLVLRDVSYIPRFRVTLDRLVADMSVSVRACAASTLIAVARHDVPLALDLFERLVTSEDALMATHDMVRFIWRGLRDHFRRLRPHVERMLRSKDPKVGEAGARLASVAALYHEDATALANEALRGEPWQRLGVAQVASHNIGEVDCRPSCEKYLRVLFQDTDLEVRREAASCFRELDGQPLTPYESLIGAFCDSTAYEADSFFLLHLLEQSHSLLPGLTCAVCEKFLSRFGGEARDMRTHRAGDVHMVVTLVFRTYHQHQNDEWAPRCLDLIDRMCIEGIHDVRKGLEEAER